MNTNQHESIDCMSWVCHEFLWNRCKTQYSYFTCISRSVPQYIHDETNRIFHASLHSLSVLIVTEVWFHWNSTHTGLKSTQCWLNTKLQRSLNFSTHESNKRWCWDQISFLLKDTRHWTILRSWHWSSDMRRSCQLKLAPFESMFFTSTNIHTTTRFRVKQQEVMSNLKLNSYRTRLWRRDSRI